jgi:polyphosphate glucokinase
MPKNLSEYKILSIDIGGTYIKGTILNIEGEMQIGYQTVETPLMPGPQKLLAAIKTLIVDFPSFNRVSIGFPGFVKEGIVYTAPSIAPNKWKNINLKQILQDEFNCLVKIVNDADMQGLGVITCEGFEILITLGTGLGSAMYLNGNLLPHLELSQHPIGKGFIYDNYIGKKVFEDLGKIVWNQRVEEVLSVLKNVFNYDHLYIGGGNSRFITLNLDDNITLVSNEDGIKGGAVLWKRPNNIEISKETIFTKSPAEVEINNGF